MLFSSSFRLKKHIQHVECSYLAWTLPLIYSHVCQKIISLNETWDGPWMRTRFLSRCANIESHAYFNYLCYVNMSGRQLINFIYAQNNILKCGRAEWKRECRERNGERKRWAANSQTRVHTNKYAQMASPLLWMKPVNERDFLNHILVRIELNNGHTTENKVAKMYNCCCCICIPNSEWWILFFLFINVALNVATVDLRKWSQFNAMNSSNGTLKNSPAANNLNFSFEIKWNDCF